LYFVQESCQCLCAFSCAASPALSAALPEALRNSHGSVQFKSAGACQDSVKCMGSETKFNVPPSPLSVNHTGYIGCRVAVPPFLHIVTKPW
jgi:hypothetical protein